MCITGDRKATGVENLGQISHFSYLVTFSEGMGEMSESSAAYDPTSDILLAGAAPRS